MYGHYNKADIQRAKAEWLRDNLCKADKRFHKGREHYVCPFCGSPDVYNPLWDVGAFYCGACKRKGSAVDVISEREGLSVGDALRRLMEGSGAKSQEYSVKPRSTATTATRAAGVIESESKRDVLQWRLTCRAYCGEAAARFRGSPGQEYAEGRGLSLDICKRFGVGFDAEAFKEGRGTGGTLAVGVPALVLPYGPRRDYYGGRLLRPLGKVKFFKPGADVAGDEPLYNGGALWAFDVVLICEGWADVLAVYQAAKVDGLTVGAVGLNGTGSRALIQALKRKPTRAKLVVSLDDDKAGHRGAVRVAGELESMGADAGVWVMGYALDGCKDFGDLLKRDAGTASELVGEICRDASQGRLYSAAEVAETWAEDL